MQNTIKRCNQLKKNGKPLDALNEMQSFIKENNKDFKAYIYAAEYAEACSNFDLAENYYQIAIKNETENAFFYLNFARYKLRRNLINESLNLFLKAYEIDNKSPLILTQMGRIFLIIGKTEKAAKYLEQAILSNPKDPHPYYVLSLCYLRMGKYNEGWNLYKLRQAHIKWKNIGWGKINPLLFRMDSRWTGQDLRKKKIIVMPEQGFGDYLMCYRYVKALIKKYSCMVSIVCHPKLYELLNHSEDIDKVFSNQDEEFNTKHFDYDFWCTIFDLPVFLPEFKPYNFSFPYIELKKTTYPKTKFSSKKPNIGISWRGSSGHQNDFFRSIHCVEVLLDLVKDKKYNFFSLQYDLNSNEQDILGEHIKYDSSLLEGFENTANFINRLDLIISVDTSTIHLASALNVPCWSLLPDFNVDWRWTDNATETIWYKSVKLYRNSNREGWSELLKKVKLDLELEFI